MTLRELIVEILESGVSLDHELDVRVNVQAKNLEVQTTDVEGEYTVEPTVDTHELEADLSIQFYGSGTNTWPVIEIETEELDLT